MSHDNRNLLPNDESFPYHLIVDGHGEHPVTNTYYPTYGWASLTYHVPSDPVYDGNPSSMAYIQEQSMSEGAINVYCDSDRFSTDPFPIHGGKRLYRLSKPEYMTGWVEGPGTVWDFMEHVRDEYYEYGVDPETLPVRVLFHRKDNENSDDPWDEYCEIYFRDGCNDCEYLMWSANEMYPIDGGNPNSELIMKMLVAFAEAYEEPNAFVNVWDHRKVTITDS